jgi:kynurenine formamidase
LDDDLVHARLPHGPQCFEHLAEDCAQDGQYTFLFVGLPLKVVNGAGSPVNPAVIK